MNTREKLLLTWAVVATLLVVVVGILLFQLVQPRYAESVQVGSADEFVVGTPRLFRCDRMEGACRRVASGAELAQDKRFANNVPEEYVEPWIWVTRDANGELKALIAVSTHRGYFVDWDAKRNVFWDEIGSKWLVDGKYQEGPAPRGLDWYPVRVEGGEVWIDFELVRGASHG